MLELERRRYMGKPPRPRDVFGYTYSSLDLPPPRMVALALREFHTPEQRREPSALLTADSALPHEPVTAIGAGC
jgi:hypothetical protein